jgi:hypothetical protein
MLSLFIIKTIPSNAIHLTPFSPPFPHIPIHSISVMHSANDPHNFPLHWLASEVGQVCQVSLNSPVLQLVVAYMIVLGMLVRRSVRYKIGGQDYEKRFDENDTVDDVIEALNQEYDRDDIVALFDGAVRVDGANRVRELNERNVYTLGLRLPASGSDSQVCTPCQIEVEPVAREKQAKKGMDGLSAKCHRAVAAGDLANLRKMRGKHKVLNSLNERGMTPLQVAAVRGDAACVSLLLKLGADLNQTDTRGATAVFFAAQEGQFEVVRVLLRLGADAHRTTCFSG